MWLSDADALKEALSLTPIYLRSQANGALMCRILLRLGLERVGGGQDGRAALSRPASRQPSFEHRRSTCRAPRRNLPPSTHTT